MATITQKNNTEPSTPANGSTVIYVDSTTKKLTTKDDAGNTTNYGTGGGTDELVKVSANDTTAGFLEAKIVAGTNITIATLNDGSNETFEISASGGGSDPSIIYYDEWLWAAADSLFNNTPLNFKPVNSGAGTSVAGVTPLNAENLAQLNIVGGTASNTFAVIYAAMPNSGSGQFLLGNLEYIYEGFCFINRLGLAGTDRGEQFIGWMNGRVAGSPSDTAMFGYEPDFSLNWLLINGQGGVYDRVDTGIPVVVNEVIKYKHRIVTLSGVKTSQLYIDDVLVASTSTRFPTASVGLVHKSKSVDAGAARTISMVGKASLTIKVAP